MTEPKSARELLEEANSFISLPIMLSQGQTITGWTSGAERERLGIVMDEHVQIIAPDALILVNYASPPSGEYQEASYQAVCAIGAVALANLTDLGLGYTGEFSSYVTQLAMNPQVCLAGMALVFAIYNHQVSLPPDHDMYLRDANDELADAIEKGFPYWVEVTRKAEAGNNLAHEEIRAAAAKNEGFITNYNDLQKSYVPVSERFTEAIKLLVENDQ